MNGMSLGRPTGWETTWPGTSCQEEFTHIYTTKGELYSSCGEFLADWSQFDSDHGVDFSAPICCQSATFVRPLFAFYGPLFFTKKKNNNNPANHNAALHFMPRMNAVFALDGATDLRQINR